MPNFKYKAQDPNGNIVTGTMMAGDEQDIHERLKTKDLMLLEAKDLSRLHHYKPLKTRALAEFARQIGTLIRAGIPLIKALQMLSEDESITTYERRVYGDVTREVMQGIPLSVAMESLKGVFPPLIINMFRAAETSGGLDYTAMRVADQYTKEDRLNAKVKNATTYPKILMGLIVIVVAIIFGFVMPQFEPLFAGMGRLPLPTTIMIGISNFFVKYWYAVIIGGVILFVVLYYAKKIPAVQYVWDLCLLRIPKIGWQFKIIYTARFARTMSSLYSSGIPIVQCLDIASHTIGNRYIEKQFEQVIADTMAGEKLSVSLGKVDGFVKKLEASIRVGEEAGSLETMLDSIADDLEFESERAIEQMVAYLEPAMIVVMAVIVGFIMIAVIVPIYQSYQTIGSA